MNRIMILGDWVTIGTRRSHGTHVGPRYPKSAYKGKRIPIEYEMRHHP